MRSQVQSPVQVGLQSSQVARTKGQKFMLVPSYTGNLRPTVGHMRLCYKRKAVSFHVARRGVDEHRTCLTAECDLLYPEGLEKEDLREGGRAEEGGGGEGRGRGKGSKGGSSR